MKVPPMTGTRRHRGPDAQASEGTSGLGRLELRALLGWLALLVGAVPFLLLWLLVQQQWSPLASLDVEVAADLNAWVSGSSMAVSALRFVTDLGRTGTAIFVLTLTTLFLLIRRRRRLAAYVATTGMGLAVLGPVTKAIVDRARPVVESPVVQTRSARGQPGRRAGDVLVMVLGAVSRGDDALAGSGPSRPPDQYIVCDPALRRRMARSPLATDGWGVVERGRHPPHNLGGVPGR
jgi:hypothetical protein